ELERVYVAQPEDVAELASVLTDNVRPDEARAFGFATAHPAADALRNLSRRMGHVKDHANAPALMAQTDLVLPEEIPVLQSLTRDDVLRRLLHLSEAERMHRADELDNVREFMLAACEGRVFYAKQAIGGQFYAYSYAVPPERSTIILDGTADLNGLY